MEKVTFTGEDDIQKLRHKLTAGIKNYRTQEKSYNLGFDDNTENSIFENDTAYDQFVPSVNNWVRIAEPVEDPPYPGKYAVYQNRLNENYTFIFFPIIIPQQWKNNEVDAKNIDDICENFRSAPKGDLIRVWSYLMDTLQPNCPNTALILAERAHSLPENMRFLADFGLKEKTYKAAKNIILDRVRPTEVEIENQIEHIFSQADQTFKENLSKDIEYEINFYLDTLPYETIEKNSREIIQNTDTLVIDLIQKHYEFNPSGQRANISWTDIITTENPRYKNFSQPC